MNERERQHQKNIERYLAEGRPVSGGDINPPGHPGYKVVTIMTSDSDEEASQKLTAAHDEGFEFVGVIGNRVIFQNYEKK